MKRTILSLLTGALLASPFAIGQSLPGEQPESAITQSVTGVDLKGKAPVNPETLRVVLPKPQEATLSNGLRVALLEDHKLPMFTLQMSIRGGGLADPPARHGLAMVTAALLREGTKERSSRDIAEQLATLGAVLSASATPSSGETAINVTGLSEHADAIFSLAADVVRHPQFPAQELEKFRTRYLSSLQYQRSLPGFLAREQFMQAVYGDHPGSHVVPPEAALQSLTREDLAAYHDKYYRPNNTILIAHGDLTLKELVAKLERVFGSWPKGEVEAVPLPSLSPPSKARVVLVDRPGSVQASLWVGGLGIERNSDDYFPMLVMNRILGGGPASRLFLNLREDKGYTYGVSSLFTGSTFPGFVAAVTDVRTAVTEGAMHELTAEIRRIGTQPVSAQELQDAKRALVGGFALSLESPQALIGNLLVQKIYGLPSDYWDRYPQRVESITAAEVQRVARKYYDPERLQIVAVGDGASLRKVLAQYGEVENGQAVIAETP